MRKIVLSIILVLLFPLVHAENSSIFLARSLEVKLTIDNEISVVPMSADYYVEYVAANLSWYPKSGDVQQVTGFLTSPQAKLGKNVEFLWEKPSVLSFSYAVEATIATRNLPMRVQQKVPFPLKDVDPSLRVYMLPSEMIDVTDDIKKMASLLAEGKDDEFDVVFALGDWVKDHVEYNLSTVTANAVQKSSWVFENRQGVCDELTSLFISMCRSLGIPAKFISGMSYTDLAMFSEKWGPHGWAEVYFPGVGWVPFDVTYRQLGYIDASHIKLREGSDSKETSVEYLSRGRNIEVKGGPLNIGVHVKNEGEQLPRLVQIEATVKYGEVGFGSYNLVTASVENMQNAYVPVDLEISRTKELDVVDGNHQASLLLHPKEKRTVSWLVQVTNGLNEGYTYTFPVEVSDSFGSAGRVEFTSTKHAPLYSYNELKGFLPKELLVKTEFNCSSVKSVYGLGENVTVWCDLKNGDTRMREYTVCNSVCVNKDVPAGKKETVILSVEKRTPGLNTIVLSATSGQEVRRSYLILEFLVSPEIAVDGLEFPKEIGFNEEGMIHFTLKKNDNSVAKNVVLKVEHKKLKKEWHFTDLDSPQEFKILFFGNNLKKGSNEFQLSVDYLDENGKAYVTRRGFQMDLVNVTAMQKVILFFDDLETSIFG